MDAWERFREQLRRAGRATGALWAAWVTPSQGQWHPHTAWGLTASRQQPLADLLATAAWRQWLSGALVQGRMRSRALPQKGTAILGKRIYAFPLKQWGVVLVGTEGTLSPSAREMWRVVALGVPELNEEDVVPLISRRRLLKRLGQDGHNIYTVAEVLLTTFQEMFPFERAYLAVRDGEHWRILRATGADAKALEGQRILRADLPQTALLEKHHFVVLPQDPWPGISTPEGMQWVGMSLVHHRQHVGFLSGVGDVSAHSLMRLEGFARRAMATGAWLLENAWTFEEMSEHLRRKAVLNDVLLAVLAAEDMAEAARHAARYLRRVFQADASAILVPSRDGEPKILGGYPPEVESAAFHPSNHLCTRVFAEGQMVHLRAESQEGLGGTVRSVLCVPLQSRREVMGALRLESAKPYAFSEDDEQLLLTVGGQLALWLEVVRLREETTARAHHMEMVYQIIKAVVSLNDLQQIVHAAAQHLAQYFGYELTAVVVVDVAQERVRFRGIAGQQAPRVPPEDKVILFPKGGVVEHVLRTGESVLINDTTTSSLYRPFESFSAGSELCVPLISENGQVMGFINIERQQRFAFTDDDLLAMKAVAGVLSAVLTSAERYQRLETTVQHLELVHQTALDIVSDLEMETLLQRIVERVQKILDVQGVEVGLVDKERSVVHIVATIEHGRPYQGFNMPLGEGIGGHVAATGEMLVLSGCQEGSPHPPLLPRDFCAVVSLPLYYKDQVLGVLTAYDGRPYRRFTEAELNLLNLLAPQVAAALRNARLYQELEERIHAQEQAEQELVQSARLAAVGEMAAAVAHELNSPLTTVMGFVELALDELEPGEIREDLSLALREARRARNIVRRLLDFAHRTEPMRIASDINTLVMDTLALVEHLLATSGVALEVNLADDLPLVLVDRAEIKQVFLNLIHNAVESMPRGGTLTIASMLQEKRGRQWAVVSIADTGVGMTPEQRMRVFEPFYTSRRDNVGLGLSVSYSIVQKHGGFIAVESQEGAGSTFAVHLPVM